MGNRNGGDEVTRLGREEAGGEGGGGVEPRGERVDGRWKMGMAAAEPESPFFVPSCC